MITLVSTPAYPDPLDPSIICRWLATESPCNFRLQRRDWLTNTPINSGGHLGITTTTDYTGSPDNNIAVYDASTNTMHVGKIASIDVGLRDLVTDIDWIDGMDITYLNDNTLYGGYYFEGRLTINGVVEVLTVIASPDSFGFADLDVSGILRIHTALGKTGDYSLPIMKEPTKSGNFSFEYRGCWYGSDEVWIPEGGCISPPSDIILWYYAECIRSEEQGSNLHEYVVNEVRDAPFLNLFERPVFFVGLPFDISFILPDLAEVSPISELIITIKIYNSVNTQLGPSVVTYVDVDDLEGFVNSLNIEEASIPETAAYMTAEIEI